MSAATPARWRFAVLPLVSFSLLVPQYFRSHRMTAEAWPAWRPIILDGLLVVAGSVLVAAVACGVHAWREAKRNA